MGPIERQLIIQKFVRDSIPANGGFADGLRALCSEEMPHQMKEATTWVTKAIDIIMTTHDNPYKTREEAAQAVLDKIGT